MKSLACVTMTYNEPDFLPIWLRYYGGQVGLRNCYVIDHGSTDGSTAELGGASRILLPRTIQDNRKRSDFVSETCGALLEYYDAIIYTDVDEFVVADPARWPGLSAYAQDAPPVTTCFGLNVVHLLSQEPMLDLAAPILAQRQYTFASSSMCKPVFVTRPVNWTAGFHSYDGPMVFGDLVMFHLAYADMHVALKRQQKRNTHVFPVGTPDHHHHADAQTVTGWLAQWNSFPRDDDVTLMADCPHRHNFIAEMQSSAQAHAGSYYGFDMLVARARLWRIPARFRQAF